MESRLIALALLGASTFGCSLERSLEHPDASGSIALTDDFACEVAEGGAVDCWGDSTWLTPDLFRDVPPVQAVHADESKICMLTVAGEVWCQETNRDVPEPATRVLGIEDAIAVDVGGRTVCAVTRDGHVRCAGGSDRRARPVVGVAGAVAVRIGYRSCAVTREGKVSCWRRHRVARRVAGIEDAVEVVPAGFWTWIVERSGRVVGISDYETEYVAGLEDAVDVAFEFDTACALRSSGGVSCWQSRPARSSLIGYDLDPLEAVEIPGIEAASDLALADRRACVREGGATRCWGTNEHFELGDAGGRPWWGEAVRVDGLPPIAEVRVSYRHSCAVSRTGELWCWGEPMAFERAEQRFYGGGPHHVLDGVITARLEGDLNCAQTSPTELSCRDVSPPCVVRILDPGPIQLPEPIEALAMSYDSLCVSDPSGLRCGRFGVGHWNPEPILLPASRSAISVEAWFGAGCAVLDDGATLCWRDYDENGDANPRRWTVAGLPPLTLIVSGAQFCGLARDGQVWCWDDDVAPTQVESLPPLRTLTSGSPTCGSDEAGDVWCWGPESRPSRVPGFAGVVQLDARGGTVCGVDEAGEVRCWGANQWRQANPASPVYSLELLEVAEDRRIRIIEVRD